MLGESLDGGNRSSGLNHPYSTFFLLSSKPTNLSSSGPQGLLVSVAVPSVSKVARRPGKEVGRMASPFGGAGQVRAQAGPNALGRAPRCSSPRVTPGRLPGGTSVPADPPVTPPDPPRPLGPQVARGSGRPRARRPSAWLLARPGAGRGSGGGRREGGIPPRGPGPSQAGAKMTAARGSDTCVARARTAVGSAVGRLQSRRGRCREALWGEEAAECGRRGRAGAEGEAGVGGERSGQSRVAACAPSALRHRSPGRRSGPRAARAAA